MQRRQISLTTWLLLTSYVLSGVTKGSPGEFVETFRGTGSYESSDGLFMGLDNPDWDFEITGDASVGESGLQYVNTGIDGDGEGEYLIVAREDHGLGGFVERLEIRHLDLGRSSIDDPPISGAYALLRHVIDPGLGPAGTAVVYLSALAYSPEVVDPNMWGLSLRHGDEREGFLVPKGDHLALEIVFDDFADTISYNYDNDINDEISATTYGPFPYPGPAAGPRSIRYVTAAAGSKRFAANGTLTHWSIEDYQDGSLGDFDNDGQLTIFDLDLLLAELTVTGEYNESFDVNMDGLVSSDDLEVWVHDLKSTWFGDANLDGEFNSSDLVGIFQAGEYEDGIEGNSTWSTGDWNPDAEFTSADLVLAFQDGGYERGPRTALSAVPEPSTTCLIALAATITVSVTRQKRF